MGKQRLAFFSSKENKKKGLIVLLILAIIFVTIVVMGKPVYSFFKDASKVRELIKGFGILAPVIFIILQTLQVLFAPIPGQAAGFVSGYLFGVWLGTIYSMIGAIIGSWIAFALARKYGRPFVEKVVNKNVLKKFDYICEDKGVFALFLIFLLPALPDDAICFIAGLTKIKIRTFLIIMIVGRLPGFFILNLIGNGVAVSQIKLSIIIFGIMMVVSILLFINREKIRKITNKAVSNLRG